MLVRGEGETPGRRSIPGPSTPRETGAASPSPSPQVYARVTYPLEGVSAVCYLSGCGGAAEVATIWQRRNDRCGGNGADCPPLLITLSLHNLPSFVGLRMIWLD
ncbi:hypothetical protein J6590_075099 [Homalodisca vitripennis]|nr:hypothetical protein J6590_075099 [Homalodisca vitripennis]